MNYIDEIANDGFVVLQDFVAPAIVDSLLQQVVSAGTDNRGSHRAGLAFGIRDLLNAVPRTRAFANSDSIRSLVEPILGSSARVVRAIYFDKHKDANWKVAWHQDLTIAVRERVDVNGIQCMVH